MKIVLRAFSMIHAVMALLFALASLLLMAIAARTGWAAVAGGIDQGAALGLIEATGLMAVAVVALQIAQTITEEEVVREAHVSGPTRVRRFLSRFLVVVVVALAIEGLIGVFKALRENPEHLGGAALLLVSVGVLLAGWGIFIRLNTAAGALEPEAMEQAKQEDRKLD
ncbi:hypothetical protein [Methylibium sp.]|uniref:hypothetical protein n=1 Tax=Methylibium sp. TaxID=2067992 RepID=UPI0033411A9B